jgi:prophage regulatory protein
MPKRTNNSDTVKRCKTCGQPIVLDQRDIRAILDQIPPRAFLRVKFLLQILPFSEATLWRKVKDDKFPQPIKISDRITGWRVEDIRKWMTDNGLV